MRILFALTLLLLAVELGSATGEREDVKPDPAEIEGSPEWWQKQKDEASAKVSSQPAMM